MNLSKKFVPIPRHAFDIGAQRKMAQAINAMRNSRIVQGNGAGIVHHSDGNMVIELPQSSAIQTFQLVSDGGDWYNCNTWDGVNAGSEIIKIAKHQDLRCISPTASPAGGAWDSKVIRGITYTYTYTAVAGITADNVNIVEYTRGVTGSDSSSETDNITPCLNIGDIISAFSTSFAGPDTLLDVVWQALADGRAWAAQP